MWERLSCLVASLKGESCNVSLGSMILTVGLDALYHSEEIPFSS